MTTDLETKVQSDIVDTLKARGWFVIRLKATNPPGVPDLLVIKDGRHIFIEVKRNAGGKITKLQLFRAGQLMNHGSEVLFMDSVNDIDKNKLK